LARPNAYYNQPLHHKSLTNGSSGLVNSPLSRTVRQLQKAYATVSIAQGTLPEGIAMSINPSPRVNYDVIAPLYDMQPIRAKTVDPELLAFVEQHAPSELLSISDVGCGTGNQLVANRAVVPHVQLVGVDRSQGMLRQARLKAPDIAWLQAEGAVLPFRAQRFDFITCQYAFHHVQDKAGMLRAVLQVLRPGGRFVLRNICPQEMADWLYYQYFPEARVLALHAFWPPETVVSVMEAVGFVAVAVEREHLRYEQDLQSWLDTVRRRETCSQLLMLPDAAYEAGVHRLERELAVGHAPQVRADHVCFVTIRGERRPGTA
jgi:ubiquinone/menaquinone biosynthesis C-methylase UbiE